MDIGMRENYISSLNPQLSSGDFMNANNARPIPQIRGSIPDFILVPYTGGNLYIKGDIAIGKYLDGEWLEERAKPALERYAKDILSHDKSVYFRFGNIELKNKQQFTFGVIHKTQWGGVLYKIDNQTNTYNPIAQPQNLNAFLRMFVAKEGSGGASGADQAYVSGSQWGAYIFKYDYKLKNESRISAYIQHFFEDGTGMVFENYPDNLYGLEFQTSEKSLVSGVVFEYIYTKQQTGTIHLGDIGDDHNIRPTDKGGNDNYYNNVDYVQGPSHFGYSLGTPLFLPPVYNTDGSVNFKGNRIIAFHLGVEGYIFPELQYRLLMTTGKNWGRYYVPFSSIQNGFASQLEIIYDCPKIEDFSIRLSGGLDTGDFFGGNTFGGSITLSKKGIISKK